MIDLSNLRAPGWQRVVAELSAPAADDRVFMARLLGALCQVSGARQGVIFTVPIQPRGESGSSEPAPDADPKPILVWPFTPEHARILERHAGAELPIDESSIERLADTKAVVRRASASRQTQAFGLDADDMLYDSQAGKGYLLAVPIAGGEATSPAGAVISLLLDNRSRQALQTTMALVEVLAGYVHAHGTGQQLRRTRAASASLDLAARLIASINNAKSFKGACIQLVNDLCRQLSVDRVAFGWVSGLSRDGKEQHSRLFSKVLAVSDTENVDRRMAMLQKIEAAMDECLDQQQAVLYPPPPSDGPGGDVLLAQAIVHAHKELAASDAKLKIATLPLRIDGTVIGVILVESAADGPIALETIELLQAALDLVAPVLRIRRSDDRWLYQRAWDSTVKAGAYLVGPRHTLWKLAGLAIMAAALVVTFVRIPYRVGADMELLPREPRTISVPFSGKIRAIGEGIEAGRSIRQGQLMVQMDTTELTLRALESQSAIVQAEKEADEARKKSQLSEAQQAEAKARQAQARLDYINYQISIARIESPISGTIIAGEVKEKVGSSVEVGQALFQVADTGDLLVLIKVDDRDISYVKEGMTGEIALKSDPARSFSFTVERIVPLSQAQEGKNNFQVRARLNETAPWFRPGMQGIAKFNTPPRSLAWIASRRIIDQARLWLWW